MPNVTSSQLISKFHSHIEVLESHMSNTVLKDFPFLSGTELHLMIQKHTTVLFHLFVFLLLGGDLQPLNWSN